jgi:sugar lactone lactonase YvrE
VARSYSASGKRNQILIIILLLLLLLGLALAWWYLSRPAELSSSEGEREEGYLFSVYGFEGDLLRRPTGVGVDPQGNIHVADTGKRRIVVFDEDGQFVTLYGETGEGALQLQDPIDVAITETGRSFVIDKTSSKMVIYDNGVPVDAIVFTDEPPTGVTIAGDELLVTTASGVVIGDLEGNFSTGYVRRGKEPGSFDRPAAVAVGEDGTLYIADSLNYRVQAISSDGSPLWQYGEPIPADQAIMYEGEDRKFGLPASIAIGENGLLYVVDGTNSEIVVLDTNGEYQETWGKVGHDDGFFYYPDGIDYWDGKLVIADKFNDRIQVFAAPGAPVPWTTYVPYLLLLLLLPLLLLPFLLRRRRYIASPGFVGVLGADPAGPEVASRLKRLYGTAALGALVSSSEELDVDWKEEDPQDEEVAKLAGDYGLDAESAESLAIAESLRGKRVLLAESDELRGAAAAVGVPTATYDEIKGALGVDEAPEISAESPDEPTDAGGEEQ